MNYFETREFLVLYNKKIQDIYQRERLVPLRGQNDDGKLNGRDLLSWTFDTLLLLDEINQVFYPQTNAPIS